MTFRSTDGRTGWWQGTNGTTIGYAGGVAPDPDPPTGDVLTAVTATRYSRLSVTLTADTTYQAVLVIGGDVSDLRLVYSFPYTGSGSLTLGAAVEWGGVVHQVTFGGVARTTLTQAERWVVSDPLPATLAKGTTVRVRTFATAGSLLMRGGAAQNGPRTSTAGDLTTPGSGPLTVNTGILDAIVEPVAIRGATSSLIAIAGMGDSIMEGGADSNSADGGGGFFDRAMRAAGVPSINFGIWADNFPMAPAADIRFGDNLAYITHGLCEYGTNQVGGAWSGFGGIANSAITFWNWVAFDQGVKLWQSTLPPRATSTDAWTTLEGQTHLPNEASRVGFNDWVRDGAPILESGTYADTGSTAPGTVRAGDPAHPLRGYVEVADTVESSRNSGLWVVNGTERWTALDGIHPAPGGHALMSAALVAWVNTL